MTIAIVLSALLLDAIFKEPQRFHPLVGFGMIVNKLESALYSDSIFRGLFALCLLLVPFLAVGLCLQQLAITPVITAILLYSAIGRSSLAEHAMNVSNALHENNISEARHRVAYIVSRDTQSIDEQGVVNATVETVLENGNDAIFAAIFWAVLAGPSGVIVYRLSNTLDAMWGYKNDRYIHFGRAAARLDDIMNFIPARLTALAYAFAGHFQQAMQCWREQAPNWKSPNAGPVMAAGAGSLGVKLGGAAVYHGKTQHRPTLGAGRAAKKSDIQRSLKLIDKALAIWIGVLLLGFLLNTALN